LGKPPWQAGLQASSPDHDADPIWQGGFGVQRVPVFEENAMFRRMMFVLLPVVAATGPLAYYSGSDWYSQVAGSLFSGTKNESPIGAWRNGGKSLVGDAGTEADAESRPLEGAAVSNLAEVLRFDVTPGWVVARWPRVSAGLAELQLHGYRVPLVTGTSNDDLAGALTYYFNHQHQVQRITFHGSTGDYRRLTTLLTSYYGFGRRPTNSPGVFLYEVPQNQNQARSYLWIEPSPIIKADEPRRRFDVTLVLERPPAR
jgi:uncharacterized protein DUF6690